MAVVYRIHFVRFVLMRRIMLFLAVLALFLPLAAHADHLDTVSIFNFTNVATNDGASGGALTGTLDVDITAGDFYAINATYTSVDSNTTFTVPDPGGAFFTNGYVGFFNSTAGDPSQPGGAQLALLLPPLSMVGYAGGNICSFANQCGGVISTVYTYDGTGVTSNSEAFNTGELDFVSSFTVDVPGPSPVPEPSSLMLLGTGLLGAVGVVRRRFNA
jgi:PEP-CTERM motif